MNEPTPLPPSQPAATPETPKIITAHVYPPIPTRAFDWIAYFDGHEEGSYGSGATEESAIADLMANNEAVDRSLQHDFMSDLPDPMAARKVSGITCNHLPRLTIASNEGGYICCECWAIEEQENAKQWEKITVDVREAIASFLPTDCNIMERPTLDALNQVFREVIATRRQRDEARKELAEWQTAFRSISGPDETPAKVVENIVARNADLTASIAQLKEERDELKKKRTADIEASTQIVKESVALRAQLSTVTRERDTARILANERGKELEAQGSSSYVEIQKTCGVLEKSRNDILAERDTALNDAKRLREALKDAYKKAARLEKAAMQVASNADSLACDLNQNKGNEE